MRHLYDYHQLALTNFKNSRRGEFLLTIDRVSQNSRFGSVYPMLACPLIDEIKIDALMLL